MKFGFSRDADRGGAGKKETAAGFGQEPLKRSEGGSPAGWGNGELRLPPSEPIRIAEPPKAAEKPAVPAEKPAAAARTKKDHTVMVIDNRTSMLVSMHIRDSGGFCTLEAPGMAEALEMLKTQKPEVIVIGAATLGFHGDLYPSEVAGAAKSGIGRLRAAAPEARLIVIDGAFDSCRKDALLEAGADIVLRRDEQTAELMPAINSLMPVRFIQTSGRSVVVMSDHPEVTGSIRTFIENAGYEARTAATYGEAVEKAADADLAIVERGLDGEGIDALIKIREGRPDMTVFMRAYDDVGDTLEIRVKNVVVIPQVFSPTWLVSLLSSYLPLPETAEQKAPPEAVPTVTAEAGGRTGPVPQPAAPAIKHATILIVDDQRDVAGLMAAYLEERDCGILTASNGREGLDAYRANRVDLVISDREMPVMSGPEMVAEIKKGNPDAKVIFLTGYSHDAELEPLRALNPLAILSKPVNFDDLGRAVDDALGP